MNKLTISGEINSKPVLDDFEGKPRLKLILKAIDREVTPEMAVYLPCEWRDPPKKYLHPGGLEVGDLVYIIGKMWQFPLKKETDIRDRTPFLNIIFLKIRTTRKDFLNMRERGSQRSEGKKN